MAQDQKAAASRNWNALIEDVVAGRWLDPETGKAATVPFEKIMLAETLDGGEQDMIGPLYLGKRLAVVSDANTHAVMGQRVTKALKGLAAIDEVVLPGNTHCDVAAIALVKEKTRAADGVIAVGSGSLQDVVKYATFEDGRKYAVFGTAASMNGYAATTASVTLASGLKTSLPAHAPRGIFLDLKVSADAPSWLSAAGFGDSLCRSTAQIDWWASHRLFGTDYFTIPYLLQAGDEPDMLKTAPGIASHSIEANGVLHRVMTLCGLGVCFTGISHHGSMGEHQVSHWLDMFAGKAHPGTTHGQQVGVASLAIARLQAELLAREAPPVVRPNVVRERDYLDRYGPEMGPLCLDVARKKARDARAAAAFNEKLAALWPQLRRELSAFVLPPAEMQKALRAAGGPVTASELGFPVAVWRDAMRFARDVRNRWSFLDLADDAGLLDDFLARERQ